MKTLLLLNMQNDYSPGGATEPCEHEAAGQKACLLLDRFREEGLPVFHVRRVAARPGVAFFRPGANGAGGCPCAAPHGGEPIILKSHPDAFKKTLLLPLLRGKKATELVIAGTMTPTCINATLRTAHALGFACVVAWDACAIHDPALADGDARNAFMAALNEPSAQVMDVETACTAL